MSAYVMNVLLARWIYMCVRQLVPLSGVTSGRDADFPLASIAHRVVIECVVNTLELVRMGIRRTIRYVLLAMISTTGQDLNILTWRVMVMTRRTRQTSRVLTA